MHKLKLQSKNGVFQRGKFEVKVWLCAIALEEVIFTAIRLVELMGKISQ